MKKPHDADAFASEHVWLDQAKQDFIADSSTTEDLIIAYGKIVSEYEKLLRTAAKISRISDIQGRMLIEREQELQAAHEQLSRSEQQRKKLMSDISHELRTPMTSIQGFLKAILDGIVPPDGTYMEMIYGKVLTVDRLVSDLFQLSRLESNQLPFQLKSMTIGQLLRPYLNKYELDAERKGLRIETSMLPLLSDGGQHEINTDPQRFEQVMTNLVFNAMKFAPEGSAIRIDAELLEMDGDGRKLIVHVTDTGIGIAEEDLPYVFDRFYRVDRMNTNTTLGVGLGLTISKEIMVRLGGDIGVDSKAGEGSTFYVTLPLCE